jgi:ceramide glucosyltransferase
MIGDALLLLLEGAATLGCVFLVAAAGLVRAFARARPPTANAARPVTILKPLHGAETGLFENLASFCRQDYRGPIQIVFGVADPNDAAIGVIARLRAAFPGLDLDLVVDPRRAGSNPKIANLINMSGRIRHDTIVVADSDIRVAPDYLARVMAALEPEGTAATCLYFGMPVGGTWARLAQLQIDSHFLPSVVVGVRLGLAHPCLGSTMALRAGDLAAIGGFAAFADCLADDYEIGAALRRRGIAVRLAPTAVGHTCTEASWRELWNHELRWALTIRSIVPVGYVGWVVSHPFPLALLALALGGGMPALALAFAAVGCRAAVLRAVERGLAAPAHAYWLIPLRDLLSFVVFVAGLTARNVVWRGHRYRLMSKGILGSERRSPSP